MAARLDEAWAAIKTGLVRGLSVGFRPHEYTYLDGGGLHFLRWEPGVQTVAVKCDLCDFLPEGPACVRACPNQALRLITGDSLQRQMKEKQRLAASWFANGGEDPHKR